MKNGDMPATGHAGQIGTNDFADAPGLTKRELFAAMAMQGLCARNDGELSHNRAAYAVEHADDLLAALEKSK